MFGDARSYVSVLSLKYAKVQIVWELYSDSLEQKSVKIKQFVYLCASNQNTYK